MRMLGDREILFKATPDQYLQEEAVRTNIFLYAGTLRIMPDFKNGQ